MNEEDKKMQATDTLLDRGVTPISIPFIQAERPHLRIVVGACRLKIVPQGSPPGSEGPEWVTGSYRDPSQALPIDVVRVGDTVTINQTRNLPEILRLFDGPPTIELALASGSPTPYALTLETGASECQVDLGGLPLLGLVVKQGAGKVELDFSRPNPVEMGVLSVSAGASGVEMRGLANANFGEMVVEGGAASYLLDFGGTLQRNAHVSISAAMAGVELYVPTTTAAKVTYTAFMGGVVPKGGFIKYDEAYCTQPALQGHSPLLSVQARLTMGGLDLHTT
jgi:hypothetical protein